MHQQKNVEKIGLELNERAKELLAFANTKRKAGLLNDIAIQVGMQQFPANKMVLSCYSKYFETMFDIEMQERYQDVVEIHGFDSDVIKMLINFMYGEEIVINSGNVIQALAAADYLQLNDVKNFCIDFLQEGLTVDICLDALIAYDMYQPASPLDHVYTFISKNFHEVFHQEKWKKLSNIQLIPLLANMTKKRVNQEHMFAAIAEWIATQELENRKIYFAELFQLLDLKSMSFEYLEENILTNEMVKENNVFLNAVLQTFSKKFREIKLNENDSKILSLNTKDYHSRDSVKEIHNIFGKTEAKYPDLPTRLSSPGAQKVRNFIYYFGGGSFVATTSRNDSIYLNGRHGKIVAEVYRIGLCDEAMEWTKVASMNLWRGVFPTAVIDDKLVAVGGYTDNKVLNSAEAYDHQLNIWRFLSPMNEARKGHAVAACNRCLIVVGGSGEKKSGPYSSAELLTELYGKWKNIKPMSTARNYLAAVAFDGYVYAIGGKSSNKIESSVEKYDFDNNSWSYVSSMKNPRWGHTACVFRGRIYVVDGNNGKGKVSVIECYNPTTNTWSNYSFACGSPPNEAVLVVV